MKFAVLLASSLFAMSAYAVPVKNCPDNLTFTYSDVNLSKSAEDILKEVNEDSEVVDSVRQTFKNIESTVKVSRSFELAKAKSGRCVYRGRDKRSNEKVELYSKAGHDVAMVQTDIGPRGILARVYVKISSLSPTELKVSSPSRAGFALAIPRHPYTDYSAGGGIYFIGSVQDLSFVVQ